jgi:hypothetical protein
MHSTARLITAGSRTHTAATGQQLVRVELEQENNRCVNSRAEAVDGAVCSVLQVQLRNGCLPATPSALMEMCLEQSVDADVDLLFIEYVANDGANRCGSAKCHPINDTNCQCTKSLSQLMQWHKLGTATVNHLSLR